MQLELIDVEFPTPKRREVGERLCLALNCKTTPYMAHKTEIDGQLLTFICEELKAIDGMKDFTFTSIHLGHNTNDVSHSACMPGSLTVCMGIGDYSGGRLRIEGGKQPLNIRGHAVVFKAAPFTSGTFNGD